MNELRKHISKAFSKILLENENPNQQYITKEDAINAFNALLDGVVPTDQIKINFPMNTNPEYSGEGFFSNTDTATIDWVFENKNWQAEMDIETTWYAELSNFQGNDLQPADSDELNYEYSVFEDTFIIDTVPTYLGELFNTDDFDKLKMKKLLSVLVRKGMYK